VSRPATLLPAMGARRATKARKRRPKDESTEQDGSQQRPQARHRSSRGLLLDLQQRVGNGVVTRLIQRQVTTPQARDVLLEQSRSFMEDGLTKVPACLALAGQLQAEAAQEATGLVPNLPSAQALIAELTLAGTLLDSGINMYRRAGGSLGDIEHLLMVRAQLSAALFYTTLAASTPASGMHSRILAHAEAALRETGEFRVAEALSAVEAEDTDAGPITQEEAVKKQAQDVVLQALYLGAFGAAPAIAP
jgi:hypothetical protein